MIVLLRDTTHENGPLTFLPRSVSQNVAAKFDYWSRKCPYRMSDEDIYSVADRKDAIEFCGPRGTVLFLESSGCFHFGSRNSIKPRFQLMLGYTGVYRTDFSEVVKKLSIFPTSASELSSAQDGPEQGPVGGLVRSGTSLLKDRSLGWPA